VTDDQRSPDLDAAIDATIRSLTAVSDDAAAESLRRTRIALADAAPRRAGLGVWRWALPAVAMTTVLVAVLLWRPWTPADAPRAVAAESRPPATAAPAPPLASATPPLIAPIVVPPRRIVEEPRRVRATSVPAATPTPAPRPDPLIALARAVQEIPEDAWSAMARAQEPLAATPELTTEPIVVPPLVTPPIADAPAEPLAEGDR
jgi:hypothetical protein